LRLHNSVGLFFASLGIIGAIPFILINGVHGDMEGAPGIVGGTLFILVNAATYYAIASFILKRIKPRK
jgi:hypothetical protein